jgi:L-lactate dehydrogenase complex protein LldF
MGSVLTPNFIGLDAAGDLANACTMNGHCASVCPVMIPLPDLLREHRRRQFVKKLSPFYSRTALAGWAFLARRPKLYQPLMSLGIKLLNWLGRRKGRFSSVPLLQAWTRTRDLPAPQTNTFQALWKKQKDKPS